MQVLRASNFRTVGQLSVQALGQVSSCGLFFFLRGASLEGVARAWFFIGMIALLIKTKYASLLP